MHIADDFGVRIGIEGEKAFKDALRDINQSFKVLGSEMQLVTSQFDKNDSSVQAVTARNAVLNKEIDQQKEKIETLRAALQNASDSFGENDRRTQNWQIQLNKAQADLNGMEKELQKNNSVLDSAGKEFDDAEKQANQFGNEITSASKQSEEASGRFDKLGGVVKGIGASLGVALAGIGAAAVGAGKSLVDASVNSAAYADEILTLSDQTHVGTEALQAYQYAAELIDTPLETFTASMARNVRSMNSAVGGSKEVTAAYARLGVSIEDSNGHLRNGEDVYWAAIDALGKISNETERDAQITQGALQLVLSLVDGIIANLPQLVNAALTMVITPASGIGDALPKLIPAMIDAVLTIVNTLLSNMDKVLAAAFKIIEGLARGLINALPRLIDRLPQIIDSIVDFIVNNLPLIIETGVKIIVELAAGLIKAIPTLVAKLPQIISALVNGLRKAARRGRDHGDADGLRFHLLLGGYQYQLRNDFADGSVCHDIVQHERLRLLRHQKHKYDRVHSQNHQ